MAIMDRLPLNLKEYIVNQGENLVDGYIRFLDEKNIDRMSDLLKSCSIWNNGVPFATTVFGDILAWEDGYVMLYKLTEEDYTVMLSGTDFFFQNLKDGEYQKDFLDVDLYNVAIQKYGEITNDQCYVLEPIPRLGGARKEKYLNLGELWSYIQILI